MFRRVALPPHVSGQLFLHSMPGRNEPFDAARAAISERDVTQVVCLAPDDEIQEKSPEYAAAIAAGLPWQHVALPVPDFGVPDDAETYRSVAKAIARALEDGENILIHCAAGIGRTGTFAAAVLCQLRVPLPDAQRLVREAGSSCESDVQRRFLEIIC